MEKEAGSRPDLMGIPALEDQGGENPPRNLRKSNQSSKKKLEKAWLPKGQMEKWREGGSDQLYQMLLIG